MLETVKAVRYSDVELEEFREIILNRLERANEDYQQLLASLNHSDGNDIQDTSPTFKTFEEGANTSELDQTQRFADRQMKLIKNLEAALVRIENKTYGICRDTGELIPKERLRAVPHATLCIDSKNDQKKIPPKFSGR